MIPKKLTTFEEVLRVAWTWASNNDCPSSLEELLNRYPRALRSTQGMFPDFHAVPEIAAAVLSYLTSPEASEDIYIYFDVGAGTIDGVAFRYDNVDGTRRVNFYSGKVAPLGIAAVVHAVVSQEAGSEVEPNQLQSEVDMERAFLDHVFKSGHSELAPYIEAIKQLVGYVVMTAKKKDLLDWHTLTVFLGGGGATVDWYRETISTTYSDYRQWSAGIPQYGLREVPRPKNLQMNGLMESDYGRFAIAYGLSVPAGEGPDIGFPSEFDILEPPTAVSDENIVDYLDSKDVYQ